MSQPSPLAPARQRARDLASSGDLGRALAVLGRALELGRANLAEDDPDVLLTAFELGRLHQQADDPAAARRVLEEAYAAGQRRLGDSDPLMLQLSHDIGVVAEELGNRHEARKAFGRVAKLGPAALGGDHPLVARARAYSGQDPSFVRPEERPPLPTATPPSVGLRDEALEPDGPAADFGPDPAGTPEAPLSEPTVVQPIITPRESGPVASGNAQRRVPPAQRSEPPRMGPKTPWTGQPTKPWTGEPTTPHPAAGPQIPAQRGPLHSGPPTMAPGPADGRPALGGGYPTTSFDPGYQGNPAPPYGPQGPGPGSAAYQKRGMGLFAAIAAVLAAIIAVVALVLVLANRSGARSNDPNVPSLGGGPAPAGVMLRDAGSKITVSWQDPSGGTVSFMVAMGHPGEQLNPVATFGPGQTSYAMGALNPNLNYCFTVIAVYRNNQFATSAESCTHRPAPSTSK